MIRVPFKTTKAGTLSKTARAFITKAYSTEVAVAQQSSIDSLHALRCDVCQVTAANPASLTALVHYHDLIDKLRVKLPVSVTALKESFSWTDSLVPSSRTTHASWDFEQACVAFNIAAWYSQHAVGIDRSTVEGIKDASKAFLTAAAGFAHVRDALVPKLLGTMSVDLTPPGLSMLVDTMLAQSQVCYFELMGKRQPKEAVRARLAMGAAATFSAAAGHIVKGVHPSYRDVTRAFHWSAHLTFQMHCFNAVAYVHQSRVARATAEAEAEGYGVEVAYLDLGERAARAAVALAGAKKLPVGGMRAYLDKIIADKARAVDDNNRIYLNPVPEQSELPAVSAAIMAKVAAPALPPHLDLTASTPRLFTSLTSAEVSGALSAFLVWREDALTRVRGEVNEAVDTARAAVTAMGLPGALDAGEGGQSGVPDALWAKIEAVQIQGGLGELQRLLAENGEAGRGAGRNLDEAEGAMAGEVRADAAMVAAHGSAWRAFPAEQAFAQDKERVARLRSVLATAAASDATVQGKIAQASQGMQHLSQGRAALTASLPAGGGGAGGIGGGPAETKEALKAALGELDALLSTKAAALESTVGAAMDEQQAAVVLAGVPPAAPGALEAAAAGLQSSWEAARPALDAVLLGPLDTLMARISTLAARWGEVTHLDEGAVARRDALQALAVSVDKWEEIRSNLGEGNAFYAGVRTHTDALLRTVKDTCHARAEQRKDLELHAASAAQVARDQAMAAAMSGGQSVPPPASTGAHPPMPGQAAAPQQPQPHAAPAPAAGGWFGAPAPAPAPVHTPAPATGWYGAPAPAPPPAATPAPAPAAAGVQLPPGAIEVARPPAGQMINVPAGFELRQYPGGRMALVPAP